jgi:hypothetical protein
VFGEYEFETFDYRSDYVSWFLRKLRRVRQSALYMGWANQGEFVYKHKVTRRSQQPYNVRHKLRNEGIISGIACFPLDEDMDSPEYEVVDGGINDNFVVICLTPLDGHEWGCNIHVCSTSQ